MSAKWLGPINAEGKEHGWGTHLWDDGDRAEGEFVDGQMQGRCVAIANLASLIGCPCYKAIRP
jgi:hypothetical protein